MPKGSRFLAFLGRWVEVSNNRPHHVPATTELRRRSRQVEQRCASSCPTLHTGEDEPLWMSAWRANLASCGFYQLPDEILLQILNNLDYVSKAMVMRTCGLLLRIMFDRALFSQVSNQSGYWRDVQIWPPFEPSKWNIPLEARLCLRQQVDHLLDRDRFCGPCRRFREDGRYEKALLALQATLWCSHCMRMHKRLLFSLQQRAASCATRVCVLVEGKAPVCAHMSIDLKFAQNFKSNGEEERVETCRHPEHDSTWLTHRKNSLTARQGCERPRVRSSHAGDDEWFKLRNETQIFLFHQPRGVPVTREMLHERLTEKAHLLDTMLCPHVRAGDGQLLLAFNPARCLCLDNYAWVNHSCTREDFFCCRCNMLKRSSPVTAFMSEDRDELRHQYCCAICQAVYRWRRDGSAVYLKIDSFNGSYCSVLRKPLNFYLTGCSWLCRIDPESWGILNDEELHRVAWCSDLNCASRWRWERLIRLLKHA